MGFMVKPGGRWAGGKIYYRLSMAEYKNEEFNTRQKAMLTTMARWQTLVNEAAGKNIISFLEIAARADQGNHVYITMGGLAAKGVGGGVFDREDSKSSTIAGRVGIMVGDTVGGISRLTLNNDLGNYPHEVGHILGLGHEHMRPADAGGAGQWQGLTVKNGLTASVEMDKTAQINNERSKCEVGPTKHDYQSIMHYKGDEIGTYFDGTQNWASKGINDKRGVDDVIAGTWRPSDGDINAVVHMYK